MKNHLNDVDGALNDHSFSTPKKNRLNSSFDFSNSQTPKHTGHPGALETSATSCKRRQICEGDRFIPSSPIVKRSQDLFAIEGTPPIASSLASSLSTTPKKKSIWFASMLQRNVLNLSNSSKVLTYTPPRTPDWGSQTNDFSSFATSFFQDKSEENSDPEAISNAPYKALDAPKMTDDYYTKALHWSAKNIIAVALHSSVHFWNCDTNSGESVIDGRENTPITSVCWNSTGTDLAVGLYNGNLCLWDLEKAEQVSQIEAHNKRIATLAWKNENILATGSRDKHVCLWDKRVLLSPVSKLSGHTQEVCGLEFCPNSGRLASGGNDNKVAVWKLEATSCPEVVNRIHKASVRGIAWSTYQHGVLFSGGGVKDCRINSWNVLRNEQINSVDSGSQICSLIFSSFSNELVSSHGYSSNSITVWKPRSLSPLTTIHAHSSRVLHVSISPDNRSIVSGSSDESLKFWRLNSKKVPSCEYDPEPKDKESKLSFQNLR